MACLLWEPYSFLMNGKVSLRCNDWHTGNLTVKNIFNRKKSTTCYGNTEIELNKPMLHCLKSTGTLCTGMHCT